jgi:hypothetical protein
MVFNAYNTCSSFRLDIKHDISTNFVRTLPLVFILTAGPGVALGIVGAIISVKKIKVLQTKKIASKNNELY